MYIHTSLKCFSYEYIPEYVKEMFGYPNSIFKPVWTLVGSKWNMSLFDIKTVFP